MTATINQENKENFEKLLKNAGWKDKEIDMAWRDGVEKSKTDTKSETDSVSEPLISPVSDLGSPSHSEKVLKNELPPSKVIKTLRAGRLYQFSTREKANGEEIFGNIFEIGFQRESDDLIVIRKKLWTEINHYEKDRETHKTEPQINEIINKAIENIKNLYIWKLEPKTLEGKEKVSYIRKIKICNAKELLETYEGDKNAKKSK